MLIPCAQRLAGRFEIALVAAHHEVDETPAFCLAGKTIETAGCHVEAETGGTLAIVERAFCLTPAFAFAGQLCEFPFVERAGRGQKVFLKMITLEVASECYGSSCEFSLELKVGIIKPFAEVIVGTEQ